MKKLYPLLSVLFLIYWGCEEEPDCAGVAGGSAVLDNCNVCDDNPENDCLQDCADTWGGSAVVDDCGVCDGSGFAFDNDFEQKWELLYGESDNEEWSEWNNPYTYSVANNSYILDISCDNFSIIWNYEENPPWEFSGSWNPIEAPSQYSYLDLIFINWDWQEVPQSYIDYFGQSAPEFVGYKFINDSLKIYYNAEDYFGIDTYIAQ